MAKNSKPSFRRTCLVTFAATVSAAAVAAANTTCFYKVLGIERSATQQQITKAYRRKSLQTHPDKNNGDRTEYDAIREAYDCLGDEDKRRIYDRYGKDGVNHSSFAAGTSASDVFRSFFHGSGRGSSHGPRQRSMKYQLEVTLEDLYVGLDRNIAIAQPGAPNKTVHVHVDRGSHDGQRIVLPGEIDFLPNVVPGDVIFILSQRPHKTFTRKGDDLAIRIDVTLDEALSGFRRTIQHLDGRDVTLVLDPKSANSRPIQKGSIRVVSECGMPLRGRPGRFGDLYIEFDVKIPSNFSRLTEAEQTQLATLLRKAVGNEDESIKKKRSGEKDSNDIRYLQTGSASNFGKNSESSFHYDDHSYVDDDFEDEFNPFSNVFGGGNGYRSFSYTNFGGTSGDGSNVQCQQM